MRFRRLVVPVLVAVILTAGAFAAYQVADHALGSAAENPDTKTVTNETVTQQVGMWQWVQKSQERYTTGFNDTVAVYNHNNTELERGTDYEWNATDGTLYFHDTEKTSDNDPANVTYHYTENTEAVKDLDGPVAVVVSALGSFGFLGAAVGLVVFLIAIGGMLAKNFADSGPRTNR